MTEKHSDSLRQRNTGDATGFQAQAQAGSQVNQAGESVNLNPITQTSEGNQSQILGKVMDSVVLYVSGGQPIINLAQPGEGKTAEAAPAKKDIGPCPYRGLLAYYEQDSEYYFGRSKEVNRLWERFCELHQGQGKTRFLAIYGPSGSGKSSLARAGLIPALAKQPLQGKDKARVAVMVPGAQPLQKLAAILAQIYQPGLTAFSEARKLARELAIANDAGAFDGLHSFVSSMLADIQTVPLVIVVDQFEEVYSLCKDTKERDAFIGNLLYAAAEVSQCVSVVVTFRSDFLGETLRTPKLNKLFANQGVLASAMDEDDLHEAIARPAEKAGHPLDEGTIQLLIDQTQGREGALPLLQFALTRIWEGMGQGVEPAKMLKDIGGVGGALAGTAQRIYNGLDKQEQAIASRFFMGLVQLGEGTQDTRRRVPVGDLISSQTEKVKVRRVLEQFASSDARLVTLASDNGQEVAEVSHEALIQHWGVLRHWIEQNRDLLRQQRSIEANAVTWQEQFYKRKYLLQSRLLVDSKQFQKKHGEQFPLSELAQNFIRSSLKWQRINRIKWLTLLIMPGLTFDYALHEALFRPYYQALESQDKQSQRAAVLFLTQDCNWLNRRTNYFSERFQEGTCRSLKRADLNDTNFYNASLRNTDLRNASLRNADLRDASLSNADLRNANLRDASLSNADLRNANLRDANLSNVFLRNANLRDAILRDTFLRSTKLHNTNFLDADLSNAILSNAILSNTILINANLSNAKFSFAIALNTDFRSTQNLTKEQLEGTYPLLLCNSPLPQDIAIDKDRDCENLPFILLTRYPDSFENLEQAQEFVKEESKKKWK